MSGLEAYYDRHHATIYLNVLSLFEGPTFLNMCQSIEGALASDEEIDVEAWLRSQESAEMKLALHAFLLSNVVLLVQDELEIDLNCFELLKNLANIKSILCSQIEKMDSKLEPLQRLLRSPVPSLSIVFDATNSIQVLRLQPSDIDAYINEAQKSLEQQSRALFKRSQFESLFQSPSSQFSHVVHLGPSPIESILATLNSHNELPTSHSSRSVQDLRRWLVAKMHAIHASAHHIGSTSSSTPQETEAKKRKKGKPRPKTFTEGWSLATSQEWFSLSHSLLQWFCSDIPTSTAFGEGGMDADEIFSAECCRHAVQSARGTYFAGLPSTYGSIYHNKRIQLALRVFNSLARGPLTESTKTEFLAECNAYWNSDHRKCDAVSMTNRPCLHSYHITREEASELHQKSLALKMTAALAASAPSYSPSIKGNASSDTAPASSNSRQKKEKEGGPISTASSTASTATEPPILPHSSDYKCLHRCNCGKNQTTRSDPFTLEQANTTFYSNPECCRYLPSLLESHLRKIRDQSDTDGPSQKEDVEDLQLLAMPHSWRLVNLGWEATVIGPKNETLSNTQGSISLSKSQNLSSTLSSNTPAYIAGQSGFYEGFEALLPWSIDLNGSMAFMAANSDSPTPNFHTSSSAESTSASSSPLAYIGLEYECHDGHRWFADVEHIASVGSSPSADTDASRKPLSSGIQSLLETSFLPIYSSCKCGKKTAQLQRIYFATPRDPSIRITFNPIVHALGKTALEDDGTPQKFLLDSGIQDHLVLPQDHVICIRLPYIYTLNNEPLLQGEMDKDSDCRFFLEPRSFGLITT